jgi:hypothetical protein
VTIVEAVFGGQGWVSGRFVNVLAHKVDVEPLVDRRRRRIVNLPAETNARVRQVPASVRDRGSSK